jgi:hypothetical protein
VLGAEPASINVTLAHGRFLAAACGLSPRFADLATLELTFV